MIRGLRINLMPAIPVKDLFFLTSCFVTLLAALSRELFGDYTLFFIGSYNFTSPEFVLFNCIIALFFSIPQIKLERSVSSICIILLFAFSVINLIRGFNVKPYDAIVSLRANGPFVFLLLLATIVATTDYNRQALVTMSRWIALATAILMWARQLFGISLFMRQSSYLSLDTINDDGRGLSAQGTILIASGLFSSLAFLFREERRVTFREAAFMLTLLSGLLLTRQGTAVLATAAGVLIVIAVAPGRSRLLRMPAAILLAALFASAAFILPALFSPETLAAVLPNFITGDVVHRLGNFEVRQLVWEGLMFDFARWSVFEQWFGLPAGQEPVIFMPILGGFYWEHSIHSMYYGLLPLNGLVGFALYLTLIGTELKKSIVLTFNGKTSDDRANSGLSLAMWTLLIIFGLSYELRAENGVMIAQALLLSRRPKRSWLGVVPNSLIPTTSRVVGPVHN